MDPRSDEKLLATLAPVQVAGLGGLSLQTFGRIVEISHQAVRLGILEAVPVGSFLKLEMADAVVWGEVRHCQDQKTWYDVELAVSPHNTGAAR